MLQHHRPLSQSSLGFGGPHTPPPDVDAFAPREDEHWRGELTSYRSLALPPGLHRAKSMDLDFASDDIDLGENDKESLASDPPPGEDSDANSDTGVRVMTDHKLATPHRSPSVSRIRPPSQIADTSSGQTSRPESTLPSAAASPKMKGASAAAQDNIFVDVDGAMVDLRDYDVAVLQAGGRREAMILDDYTWALREQLGDDQVTDGLLAALETDASKLRATTDVMSRAAWLELCESYRDRGGEFDNARIKSDAAHGVLYKGLTTYELSNVIQNADDMENVFLTMSEPHDTMYEAEALRERTVARERAIQRARAHRQLEWYQETYGMSSGKKMYEASRDQRLKAVTPRLTLNEMRKNVYAAEYALKYIVSEFSGYIITSVTVVMFMIHPNITQQFFMTLSCKSIGGSADPSATYLLNDLTQQCYSSTHLTYIIVLSAPMLILWVLGVPFFALMILYRNRALIQAPAFGTATIVRMKKKIFESQMAFLYRGYKPQRYFWFLIEMARKVALVAISVFFPGARNTQLMMASLLIFGCLIIQIFFQPFENHIPATVELISLGTSFMIFFLANFLFVSTVTDNVKTIITVLIITLVLMFFVVVVLGVLVLTRDELALAPLRKRLREAHALGQDVFQVLRRWRIEHVRSAPQAGDETTAATSAPPVGSEAEPTAETVPRKVGALDELVNMSDDIQPSWNCTLEGVRRDATEQADDLEKLAGNVEVEKTHIDPLDAHPVLHLTYGDDDDEDHGDDDASSTISDSRTN